MGHDNVGTEDLLLGLLAEKDSVAAKSLLQCGINLQIARKQVCFARCQCPTS